MEQLSGIDSFMLHTERGNAYNHIAGLGIYDPAVAPGGKVRFRDILAHFGARLSLHRLFRRTLVTVPLGVDRPYWLDGDHVDVEFHVRHIALPEPGDWRQLMIQVARLHSRPLDRARPLWEVYVIEGLDRIPGLPPGAFAVYQKYHHASVDGQSAGALMMALHASSPVAQAPLREVIHHDRPAAVTTLYVQALANTLRRTAGASALYVKTLRRVASLKAADLASLVTGGATDAAAALPGFVRAPATRFNGKVSAHRVVEAVGLPLS